MILCQWWGWLRCKECSYRIQFFLSSIRFPTSARTTAFECCTSQCSFNAESPVTVDPKPITVKGASFKRLLQHFVKMTVQEKQMYHLLVKDMRLMFPYFLRIHPLHDYRTSLQTCELNISFKNKNTRKTKNRSTQIMKKSIYLHSKNPRLQIDQVGKQSNNPQPEKQMKIQKVKN